ncbi:MAG TPA: DNA mismatch repair protein MutS [Clostridiales bacterium]|nr:MAG: DNA mismatch repair protein MutS [Clostridiales bacterium GWD2_32_19]HCC07089.1 DNA mismatch repair protein MutS [Clostridiales bacterium]
MAKLTPMMQQYMEIKEKNKDTILFFRLGDFYEMFFEDAKLASRELEITLTGRDCGQDDKAPMCGVPHHAAENYIARLVDKGYKVAICEQVEDPKEAKGIVRREVVRVITPGTVIDTEKLDQSKNNYIASIFRKETSYGLSFIDVTTGEFKVTELVNITSNTKVFDEIAKYNPSEIIINEEVHKDTIFVNEIKQRFNSFTNLYEDWNFEAKTCYKLLTGHFKVTSLDGFGAKSYTVGISSAGALIQYLKENQKTDLGHIYKLTPYQTNEYMLIDISTRRNLELVETMREKTKKGSLLWVLDKTKTAMGARLIRKWIEQPLINEGDITRRLDAVAKLKDAPMSRDEIKEVLTEVYDLERLLSKVVYNTANARDLNAMKSSISHLPELRNILSGFRCDYLENIYQKIDVLSDICTLIDESIEENPPFSMKDGDIIKLGYSDEIDKLRSAKKNGKDWIANLEAEEKEKTGIKNLKIRYNNVFGYYIEITNSNLNNVPDRYTRKQTLANAERYTLPELKEIENMILSAEERVIKLEYEVFNKVREQILTQVDRIQETSGFIAETDVLTSLAEVAEAQNYSRPIVKKGNFINIDKGRHPVIEKILVSDDFIDNDTLLTTEDNMIIITGPNMAGKSTYMRQVALITLMAQIGSFVPANNAEIGIVDRIFTRVGASDDLASGQSTFMVEMSEVANILNNATNDSLLILDEIGRGTSTFDGLSIAWSVVEYIQQNIKAKTLFATHYHELTELEGKLEGVKNYRIAVKENGDDIIFLRKIVRGGTDNSYGIQVAKLAGLPMSVINRANEILNVELKVESRKLKLEKDGKQMPPLTEGRLGGVPFVDVVPACTPNSAQITLFTDNKYDDLIDEIKNMDINNMTPMEALAKLVELRDKI